MSDTIDLVSSPEKSVIFVADGSDIDDIAGRALERISNISLASHVESLQCNEFKESVNENNLLDANISLTQRSDGDSDDSLLNESVWTESNVPLSSIVGSLRLRESKESVPDTNRLAAIVSLTHSSEGDSDDFLLNESVWSESNVPLSSIVGSLKLKESKESVPETNRLAAKVSLTHSSEGDSDDSLLNESVWTELNVSSNKTKSDEGATNSNNTLTFLSQVRHSDDLYNHIEYTHHIKKPSSKHEKLKSKNGTVYKKIQNSQISWDGMHVVDEQEESGFLGRGHFNNDAFEATVALENVEIDSAALNFDIDSKKAAAKTEGKRANARLERYENKSGREEKKIHEKAVKDRERKEKELEKRKMGSLKGKYVSDEIACVIDSKWLDSLSEIDQDTISKLNIEENRGVLFSLFKSEGLMEGAIWWTIRSVIHGGAAVSGHNVSTLKDAAIVMIDPVEFCQMLERRSEYPNLFPSVRLFVMQALETYASFRVILMVQSLQRVLAELTTRAYSSNDACGRIIIQMSDVDECISWLLINYNLELVVTKDAKETAQHINIMSRYLARNVYREPRKEHAYIPRKKCSIGNDCSLSDVWLRQLTMIPGVSEPKARSIAHQYPTLLSLLTALTDPSNEDPSTLLVDMLGNRNEFELSKKIFKYFTAVDGDDVI